VYYDIILQHSGDNRVWTIKQIRLCTGMGLLEAYNLAKHPPRIIKAGIGRREAEDIRQAFAQIGARAEIVPSRSKISGRQRRQTILRKLNMR
jgi:large subunit ribosomal protein L7/L12